MCYISLFILGHLPALIKASDLLILSWISLKEFDRSQKFKDIIVLEAQSTCPFIILRLYNTAVPSSPQNGQVYFSNIIYIVISFSFLTIVTSSLVFKNSSFQVNRSKSKKTYLQKVNEKVDIGYNDIGYWTLGII